MSDEDVYTLSFEYTIHNEQHFRDAGHADDYPADELHIWHRDGEIWVDGTPEGVRWLYDYLTHLERYWRAEGEQWDADVAGELADTVWESTDGELPDQQRARRLTDGGEQA